MPELDTTRRKGLGSSARGLPPSHDPQRQLGVERKGRGERNARPEGTAEEAGTERLKEERTKVTDAPLAKAVERGTGEALD
jgi:hypothetical protein